jgi:hypothetical protein
VIDWDNEMYLKPVIGTLQLISQLSSFEWRTSLSKKNFDSEFSVYVYQYVIFCLSVWQLHFPCLCDVILIRGRSFTDNWHFGTKHET